jgi:hypothetical protein
MSLASCVQAFKTSFTALAGEKESFFDAAILIFAPLAGLRPSRSGEVLTLNFPNPAKETSSSLAAAGQLPVSWTGS